MQFTPVTIQLTIQAALHDAEPPTLDPSRPLLLLANQGKQLGDDIHASVGDLGEGGLSWEDP